MFDRYINKSSHEWVMFHGYVKHISELRRLWDETLFYIPNEVPQNPQVYHHSHEHTIAWGIHIPYPDKHNSRNTLVIPKIYIPNAVHPAKGVDFHQVNSIPEWKSLCDVRWWSVKLAHATTQTWYLSTVYKFDSPCFSGNFPYVCQFVFLETEVLLLDLCQSMF